MTRRARTVLLRLLALGALFATVAAGVTAVGAPAGAATSTIGGYAVTRPVCAQPSTPDTVRCLAWRSVPVRKGTKGARPWLRYTGVSYGPTRHGYSPAALATAYAYNPDIARSNQTVAVIDWFDNPHALGDLNVFDRQYHLPTETASSFRKVNERGQTTGLPEFDAGSATEISLDVQAVRGVCHTCRILLVEASRPTLVNLANAVNTAARLGATEISNSYGMPEQRGIPYAVVHSYDHPGVVVTASTGDDGWYGWDCLNGCPPGPQESDGAPSFPSTLPTVVAVGGTTLAVNPNGTRNQESVWNNNGASDQVGAQPQALAQGASGGGCSRVFTAPVWQKATPGYAAAGCNGMRLGTDVSAIADPQHGFDVYDSYSGGWVTVGGTSLSAPVVAAMYALNGGADSASYPASSLYTNRTYRASAFSDVTVGGTGFCGGDTLATCSAAVSSYTNGEHSNPNRLGAGPADCSFPNSSESYGSLPVSPQCNAAPGFDGASGVGAPNSARGEFPTTAKLSIVHVPTAHLGRQTSLSVTITQRVPGTRVTGITWLFDDGTTVSGTGFVHHTWRTRGAHTAVVRISDTLHQLSTTHVTISVS